ERLYHFLYDCLSPTDTTSDRAYGSMGIDKVYLAAISVPVARDRGSGPCNHSRTCTRYRTVRKNHSHRISIGSTKEGTNEQYNLTNNCRSAGGDSIQRSET